MRTAAATDRLERGLGDRSVDLDQRDGAAAAGRPAEMEVGDVDPCAAEDRSELADETRLVAVAHEQHAPADFGFEVDVLDLDHTGARAAEKRPRDDPPAPFGLYRHPDQRLVVAGAVATYLADHDVPVAAPLP